MAYRKTVKGDNNQANEVGSFNHLTIFNDGSGKIIVCFLIALAIAIIIYLWIAFHLVLLILMFGTTFVLCIVGVSAAFRHVSNTRKQHLVNEAEIEWSRLVYRTENLIATFNRSTREITVHNAQEIQEVHHHALPQMQITESASAKNSLMPKLSDLNRE